MTAETRWRTPSAILALFLVTGFAAPALVAQAPADPPAQLHGELGSAETLESAEYRFPRRDCCERTKYGVLVARQDVPEFEEPFGPGYQVAFDEVIDTKGYSEIRLWVHVFVDNYATGPVTSQAQLNVRFLHQFPGGSFDYERQTLGWNNVTSYINGYVARPILGDSLRVLCSPRNMPPGPYDIFVTYLLVR